MKKNCRFVVFKFVKLSDELINNLHNTLIALQRSTKFWIGYVILLNKIFVLQNPCVHFLENKVGKKETNKLFLKGILMQDAQY